MDKILLISDAAKEVKVESHVLRYWEDELKLPIKRNELGHRYYTDEDVKRFKQIKIMKEQGLQLKAIKMILKDGKLNVVSFSGQEAPNALTGADRQDEDEINAGYDKVETQNGTEPKREMAITVVSEDEVEVSDGNPDARKEAETAMVEETSSEKAKRLQWLLQQLIRETLQENNRELSREIRGRDHQGDRLSVPHPGRAGGREGTTAK